MIDLRIENGTIITAEGRFQGDIEIDGGKITAIRTDAGPRSEAKETVDISGQFVMPGMIDTHVHIRGGRLSHREDFTSGTMAAASGGVTTVMEMPVCNPPASRYQAFLEREREASSGSYVDYALYGGAGDDNVDEIAPLADAGAVAYKTFLMPPVPGREAEFYGLCCDTYGALVTAMRIVAKTGLVLSIHGELNEFVAAETEKVMAEGGNDLRAYARSRPKIAEIEAAKRIVKAVRETGCRVSMCHVSTPETVELIREARAEGLDIHAETCPHYILFNCESSWNAGVFARIKPPLRDPENMEALIRQYADGLIETTGSDHAPYLRNEKLKNGNDIWHSFDGLPGLELSLPLLLNAAEEGKLTYEQIVRNTSKNAAHIYGLAPQKGLLAPGSDADLVVFRRLDTPEGLNTARLFTKARDSADLYAGTSFSHRIEATYVRGKCVYSGGTISGAPRWGKFVKPNR